MTFPDWLRSLGLHPPDDITPGRWIRVPSDTHPRKKNASIKLDESGEVGFAQDWANDAGLLIWFRDGESKSPEYDHAAAQRRIDARAAEEAAGTARARAAYDAAEPLTHANHPYLSAKRITMLGCSGLRVDSKGALIIPMWRNRQMVSCQRIATDGSKLFVAGAPTKGGTFWIHRMRSAVTILCEGFVTGCTVFESVQTAGVMVCFSASNMVEVAKLLSWRGLVCVAGDSDHGTYAKIGRNPGLLAAAEAAQIIGCGYACPDEAEGVSDWNDVFVSRLETLEEAELGARFRTSPWKLRRAALAPIAASLMRACRKIV